MLWLVRYVSQLPRPPLDALVDDLYALTGTPPYARLLLPPMPSAVLIVNLGPPFVIRGRAYADGVVISTLTAALDFAYPPGTRSVGVHFKPFGLAPFVGLPAAELRDEPVALEDVWGRAATAALRERLAAAPDPLALLEDELRRRQRHADGLALVRHTSAALEASGGAAAIGALTAAAGVSSTYLTRRFRDLVGVTPKRLARTYRFADAVRAIDPAGPIDWLEIAARGGYYDQAHFGNDFRAFTGLSPTRYLAVRRRFLREHPGHALDVGPLPAE
jgi:AraC-like DNA-binding protein